jgi:hypothetical protein
MEEFRNYDLESVGSPNLGILFFCKAGRHRSFAMAVCFTMFMMPWANHESLVHHLSSIHSRFDLGATHETRVIGGRKRLSLIAFVQEFSEYVKYMYQDRNYVFQKVPALKASRYERPGGR